MGSLGQITDLCNRASVVIYTIDPRGILTLGFTAADQPQAGSGPDFAAMLSEKSSDYLVSQVGLGLLARETGGLSIHDTNDINLGLRRVLQDQSGYYLIGYTPAESTFATKAGRPLFHKIRVQVKRRGVRVRTRTGFRRAGSRRPTRPEQWDRTPARRAELALQQWNPSAVDPAPSPAKKKALSSTRCSTSTVMIWHSPRSPTVRAKQCWTS